MNDKSNPNKLKRYYNVDDNKLKDLEGLEELVDTFVDDEEKKLRKRHSKEVEKYGESYELYNYLELERKRLGMIDDFLSNKLQNMKQHSQVNTLIQKQQKQRVYMRQELIEQLTDKNSLFIKQMRRLFEKAFTARGPK